MAFSSHTLWACSLFLRGGAFSAWGGKLLAFRVSAERFPPERERRRHALGPVASLRRGAAHHAGRRGGYVGVFGRPGRGAGMSAVH